MPLQLPLLSDLTPPPTAPYVAGSETSKEAALSVAPHLGALQSRVLAWFQQHGCGTDEELIDSLKLSPSTARPRRIELCAKGLIQDSGMKQGTRSGRKAVIWELTPKGNVR